MTKNSFVNHSGGALGADMAFDEIGRRHGFTQHIHYRPMDYFDAAPELKRIINLAVGDAAKALGRPDSFKGIDLVRRNWFQVRDEIFAISRIVKPNERDWKGFTNKAGKEVIAGGTGWAVEMGIQKDIPVYVYDINTDKWHYWSSMDNKFKEIRDQDSVFIVCPNYAGIGSRQLTFNALQAIEQLYLNTIKVHKLN